MYMLPPPNSTWSSPVRAPPWCRPARHVSGGFPLPPRVGLAGWRHPASAREQGKQSDARKVRPPSLWPSPPMTRAGQRARNPAPLLCPRSRLRPNRARVTGTARRETPSRPPSREWSTRIGGASSRGSGSDRHVRDVAGPS